MGGVMKKTLISLCLAGFVGISMAASESSPIMLEGFEALAAAHVTAITFKTSAGADQAKKLLMVEMIPVNAKQIKIEPLTISDGKTIWRMSLSFIQAKWLESASSDALTPAFFDTLMSDELFSYSFDANQSAANDFAQKFGFQAKTVHMKRGAFMDVVGYCVLPSASPIESR